HRRGRQQLVVKNQRRDQYQQRDNDEVLQDRRIPVGNAIVAQGVQKRDDDEVDHAGGKRQPLDRDQLLVDGGIRREAKREDDVNDDVGAEQQQRQLQLPPHQAVRGQRRNRERRRQRDEAKDEVPGVVKTHPMLHDALFELGKICRIDEDRDSGGIR